MKLIFRSDIEVNNTVRINLFDIGTIFRYSLIRVFVGSMDDFQSKLFYFKSFVVRDVNTKFKFDVFDNVARTVLSLLLNAREDEIANKLCCCLLVTRMVDANTRMI